MHDAARGFVARVVTGRQFANVVEVGGRNVNGGVVDLIDYTQTYTAIDLYDGPGVDVVADIRDWDTEVAADLVICCEVLEHCEDVPAVVASCVRQMAPGGYLVITCAGPDRAPHSGHDGGPVRPGEHYANVKPTDLEAILELIGMDGVAVEYHAHLGDLYATATMPGGAACA